MRLKVTSIRMYRRFTMPSRSPFHGWSIVATASSEAPASVGGVAAASVAPVLAPDAGGGGAAPVPPVSPGLALEQAATAVRMQIVAARMALARAGCSMY